MKQCGKHSTTETTERIMFKNSVNSLIFADQEAFSLN